jgi:phosphoribosylamine-glycine ligase
MKVNRSSKVKFIRKNGRIIPIRLKAAGLAVGGSILAVNAAAKIRKYAASKITKKKSFGRLGNFAIDSFLAGAAITIAAKKSKMFGQGLKTIINAGIIKLN